MTKAVDDKTSHDTKAVFDKQRAAAAVEAFNAGQASALAVAGHLPRALKRIEELEGACRAGLRIIEDSRQFALSLKVLEVCLLAALPPEKGAGSCLDQRRLRDGANALAVSSTPPTTATEARAQLAMVGEGIAALQSLDDLGEEANAHAERAQQELWKRHEALKTQLKDLEVTELSAPPSGRWTLSLNSQRRDAMMKSYAKKRDVVCAVQWTGSMTLEMIELVGDRPSVHVDSSRQLVFANAKGPGRFASEGDWLVSSSGEDLTVVGDDVFRTTYEEVDEAGRTMPTDAEHEAAYQDFVRELDALLVAGLKLSREAHANIFRARDHLIRTLSALLADQAYTAARRERHRVCDKITKDLRP